MGRGATVLRCEGTGDGGLFTGILVRYLALAAVDGRLPAATRATAAALVNDTAEAFWEGRRHLCGRGPAGPEGRPHPVPLRPELPARDTCPAGAAVELSTQLQAWMVLEAAAAIAAATGIKSRNSFVIDVILSHKRPQLGCLGLANLQFFVVSMP